MVPNRCIDEYNSCSSYSLLISPPQIARRDGRPLRQSPIWNPLMFFHY